MHAALQVELKDQKGHFEVALTALKTRNPKKVVTHEIINKIIPELCICPVCKTALCSDDEDLHYCPACGQALQF